MTVEFLLCLMEIREINPIYWLGNFKGAVLVCWVLSNFKRRLVWLHPDIVITVWWLGSAHWFKHLVSTCRIFELSVSFVWTGGDRERMTSNHETYLLMASTQNDMEDWVKTIRRVIWAPFGGGEYTLTPWELYMGSLFVGDFGCLQ